MTIEFRKTFLFLIWNIELSILEVPSFHLIVESRLVVKRFVYCTEDNGLKLNSTLK